MDILSLRLLPTEPQFRTWVGKVPLSESPDLFSTTTAQVMDRRPWEQLMHMLFLPPRFHTHLRPSPFGDVWDDSLSIVRYALLGAWAKTLYDLNHVVKEMSDLPTLKATWRLRLAGGSLVYLGFKNSGTAMVLGCMACVGQAWGMRLSRQAAQVQGVRLEPDEDVERCPWHYGLSGAMAGSSLTILESLVQRPIFVNIVRYAAWGGIAGYIYGTVRTKIQSGIRSERPPQAVLEAAKRSALPEA